MQQGDDRYCDSCGQPLPGRSKLSYFRIPLQEAPRLTSRTDLTTDPDGIVTLDICLQCQVTYTHKKRGLI